MSDQLITPRFQTAQSGLPGDSLIWDIVLDQSDIFAYHTANQGKGGPFGAQLWLVNPTLNKYVIVGTAQSSEDSNAVVSKGIASAHAEAENLSPEKRSQIIEFLQEHQDQGWKIVQVSSGESCPSCRAKQVTFADELIGRGLIQKHDFHVVFKATYDQTKRDAGFNDAPYDQTFRAIDALGILDADAGLLSLEDSLMNDNVAKSQIDTGELIYSAVDLVQSHNISHDINTIFQNAGTQPVAVIERKDGSILSYAFDERDQQNDSINYPEKTAIISALCKAAKTLRKDEDKRESWDLEAARLLTNIREIGPMAYAESLWYNLSGISIIANYTDDVIDDMAQEKPGTSNRNLFKQVAAEYNNSICPLTVTFNGNLKEPSAAHLIWKAKMLEESIRRKQADRLQQLKNQGICPNMQFIDGTQASLSDFVLSSEQSSHYDGKQAKPEIK